VIDLTKYEVIFANCTVRSYFLIRRRHSTRPVSRPPPSYILLSSSRCLFRLRHRLHIVSPPPSCLHAVVYAPSTPCVIDSSLPHLCAVGNTPLLQRHLHFPHLPHRCHLLTAVMSSPPSYLRHYHISAPSSTALSISCLIYSTSVSTASSLASPPPSLILPLPPSPTVVVFPPRPSSKSTSTEMIAVHWLCTSRDRE